MADQFAVRGWDDEPPSAAAPDFETRGWGDEPESSSIARRVVGDTAVSLAKGVVSVPETAVGLADLATGGRVGKFLEEELGFRPDEAKKALDRLKTREQMEADAKVDKAEGFVDTVKAAVSNPSTIVHGAAEAIPGMLGGGAVARGLLKAAPRVAPVLAGAAGEGIVSAGSTAEQIRQQTPDRLLTPEQSALAAGSGVATGALGVAGGKVAAKLGLADVDTLLAGGVNSATKGGIIRRVTGGALAEGVFEELPQSIQEQVAQNVALGKPWDEGVDKAAAMGMLVGGAMGGGGNVISRAQPAPTEAPVPIEEANPIAAAAPILEAATVEDAIVEAERMMESSEYTRAPSEAQRAAERAGIDFEVPDVAAMQAENAAAVTESGPVGNELDFNDPVQRRGGEMPRARDELAADLQREPAPLEPPQIALPGPQEQPNVALARPGEQDGDAVTRFQREYGDALIKQQRGELLSSYERVLVDNPPPGPAIVRPGVDPARGPRDPAQMTAKELDLAVRLTRSAERKQTLQAEIDRRASAPSAQAQTEVTNASMETANQPTADSAAIPLGVFDSEATAAEAEQGTALAEVTAPAQTASDERAERADPVGSAPSAGVVDPASRVADRDVALQRSDSSERNEGAAVPAQTALRADGPGAVASPERRLDTAARKRVADMTTEERAAALLTSEKAPRLPNGRAYSEAPKRPVQAAIDLDDFKSINDKIAYAMGDQVIARVGEELAAAGLDAYHLSGDEFVGQFDDDASAKAALEQVRERLSRAVVTIQTPDGRTLTHKGVGFSYGLAQDHPAADRALKADKLTRKQLGLRAGTRDAVGVPEQPSAREQAAGRENPERVAPTKPTEAPADAGASASGPTIDAVPPALLKRITVPVEEFHEGEGVKTRQVSAAEALASIDEEIAAYEKLKACVSA